MIREARRQGTWKRLREKENSIYFLFSCSLFFLLLFSINVCPNLAYTFNCSALSSVRNSQAEVSQHPADLSRLVFNSLVRLTASESVESSLIWWHEASGSTNRDRPKEDNERKREREREEKHRGGQEDDEEEEGEEEDYEEENEGEEQADSRWWRAGRPVGGPL